MIALVVLAFWFFGGPNLGFTKTSVAHIEKDPVTEIETPRYEKRFVPGVDFLAAGLGLAVVLAGSFIFLSQAGATGKGGMP